MAYIIPNPYTGLPQSEKLERMYALLDRNSNDAARERPEVADQLETLAVAIARGYGWTCTE